jgi:hypothetical protein
MCRLRIQQWLGVVYVPSLFFSSYTRRTEGDEFYPACQGFKRQAAMEFSDFLCNCPACSCLLVVKVAINRISSEGYPALFPVLGFAFA